MHGVYGLVLRIFATPPHHSWRITAAKASLHEHRLVFPIYNEDVVRVYEDAATYESLEKPASLSGSISSS